MAKEKVKNGNRTIWSAAGVVLGFLIIGGGMLVTFTKSQGLAEAVGEKVDIVKAEGCLPARQANTSVKVIETRLDSMEATQTTRHTEIMTELKRRPAGPSDPP